MPAAITWLAACVGISLLWPAYASASDVVSRGSTATQVTTGANGQAQIKPAPMQNGVSYNAFSRFDVNAAGATFANQDVRARTIVAEVFSPLPSRIEGPVNVDGPRANLILANQNGISVNGASFVNFGSLALTTGEVSLRDVQLTPDLTQRYVDLRTRGGEIQIGAAGLDTNVIRLELNAKRIGIAGPITNAFTSDSAVTRLVVGDSEATDIKVKAGRDVNVLAAYDKVQSTSDSHNSGWSMGLTDVKTGSMNMNRANQRGTSEGGRASTSLLSANAGSVSITGGTDAQYKGTGQGKVLIQGADILAKNGVSVTGNKVDLQAVHDSTTSTYHVDTKSLVINNAKLAGVAGLVKTGVEMATSKGSGNDRLDAAQALKFGYDAYKTISAISEMSNVGADMLLGAGVSVSSQYSQSHADSSSSARRE